MNLMEKQKMKDEKLRKIVSTGRNAKNNLQHNEQKDGPLIANNLGTNRSLTMLD